MQRQAFFRRMTPFLFICLVALVVVACGGISPSITSQFTPAPPDKQVLHLPLGAPDFSSLDPALAAITGDVYAVSAIFTGLVRLNGDGTVADQLATSHQVSPDGLTYTFTLPSGLHFSDGTPLTATDVAYSINRAIAPATHAPLASFLQSIKDYSKMITGQMPTLIGDSLLVRDEQTIVIQLGHPAPYFLSGLAQPLTFPVNKKLIAKYGTAWTDHLEEGAGDGPFKVASYSHSTGLTLVPNPTYYGPKPKLQKVEILPSSDTSVTYKEYQAGQLDLTFVPAVDLASVKSQRDYKHAPTLDVSFLEMNYLAKPFDNIKIRQAFALAIDKDTLAQYVLRGAVLPTNHILPQGMPGYNRSLTGPTGVVATQGDQSLARRLLQEGMQEDGYSSVSQLPQITFSYYEDKDIANVALALIQQWQVVLGITVRPSVEISSVLVQQMTNTTGNACPLQLWILGYGNYADPQGWLSVFFGKGGAFNNMNYGQNHSSDAVLQQAVQTELQQADFNLNPTQRMQQYNDAEQKLVNDVAWLPLYQLEIQLLVNPKLQNYPVNSLGIVEPDAWTNIYFAQ